MYSDNSISLPLFFNDDTLNIFSDASFHAESKFGGIGSSCYGVVAVCKEEVVDSSFRICSNSTSNQGELRGVRAALSIANKYIGNYKFINIFSDSLYSVYSLTLYADKYTVDDRTRTLCKNCKEIKNSDLITECLILLNTLKEQKITDIHIFHQHGHIKERDNKAVRNAGRDFLKINNLCGDIDYNLIKYLSSFNNFVDDRSRIMLKAQVSRKTCIDPVSFYASSKILNI